MRHIHIWEIDSDGRGPNYFEANEMGPNNEVIDHDIDEWIGLDEIIDHVSARFPDAKVTLHRSGWRT